MPIRLSQVGKQQKTATVAYDGETVDIVYRPGAFTPRVEARINEAQKDSTVSQELAQILSEVIISWDVLDDDGQPLPPTIDLLMDLPLAFLSAVSVGIGEDMRPEGQSA